MEPLDIHLRIKEKLKSFISKQKIPNIIFHGPSGSGKRTLIQDFIKDIYDNDKNKLQNYIMYVNCAHGKGIKFIREELKFFAKTNINHEKGLIFKTVILLNADKLTIDAQSALRRCIELFSHNTRFFIIIEEKDKLLKPIISRFCEIYIPFPTYQNKKINLYHYNKLPYTSAKTEKEHLSWLHKQFKKENSNINQLYLQARTFYEKSYSAQDLIKFMEQEYPDTLKKYELLLYFNKIKKEIRNEKLLILIILHFLVLRPDYDFKNISFM